MTWEAFSTAGQPNRQNLSLKEPSMSSRKVWKREVWFSAGCDGCEDDAERLRPSYGEGKTKAWKRGLEIEDCLGAAVDLEVAWARPALEGDSVRWVDGTRFAAPYAELASLSAISLPSIPTWLGIQMIETLLPDIMTFARRLIVGMGGWEKNSSANCNPSSSAE